MAASMSSARGVQAEVGAQRARRRRPCPAPREVAMTRAPAALAIWMAVTPMPLVAPWISRVSPAFSAAGLEDIGEDGADGLGQGGGLDQVEAGGDGQGVAGVDDGVVGIAAAAQQGADPVAEPPARDAVADLIDLAGDLQARGCPDAPGGGRIAAEALQQVGPVDPGGRARGSGFGPVPRRDRAAPRGVRASAGPGAARDLDRPACARPVLAIVRVRAFR